MIQNWNSHPEFLAFGDVELELDPGQEVAVWVNRGGARPELQVQMGSYQSSLVILAEEQNLLI